MNINMIANANVRGLVIGFWLLAICVLPSCDSNNCGLADTYRCKNGWVERCNEKDWTKIADCISGSTECRSQGMYMASCVTIEETGMWDSGTEDTGM